MSATSPQRNTRPDSIEEALDDIATRGVEAIRNAKTRVDETVDRTAQLGADAVESAREVRGSIDQYVRQSVRERPYSTLMIAGLVGFAYAALRPR